MKVIVTAECPRCHQPSQVEVEEAGLLRWMQGASVQDVLPELSQEQREVLLTGYHTDCWEEDFAPVEEE